MPYLILVSFLFIQSKKIQQNNNFEMEQQSRNEEVSRSHTTQQAQQRFIFELLQKVGADGNYQKISLIAWCICGFFSGCILLCTPYMLFQDPYVCSAQITQNCEAYVCSLMPSQRSAYLPTTTIHSVLNNYGDFRCSPQTNHVSLIILIMYFGLVAAQLVLVLAGDIFTRKTITIAGFIQLIIGCLLVVFGSNLIMAVTGLFMMMMGVQLVYTYSFIFLCETVSQEIREHYQVWIHINFGLGQCANVGLYYWLGNGKPVIIFFYLIPAIIAFLILIFFVVDTPICLVKNYETTEAYARFMWIAKVNGIQNCELKMQDLDAVKQMQNVREQQEKSNSKFSLLDLFRYSSLRYITIFIALARLSVEFLFFVPNFMIAEFQLSIYINGLSLGLSSLTAFIICFFVISKLKRKSFGVFSFSVVFICTLVLIYFWKPKGDGQALSLATNIGILIAIIIINLLVSMEFSIFQVYTTQLYPSQVRVIAIGFVIVMGASGVSVSSFIINACSDNGISAMIVFAVLAFVGIVSSLILPETLKVPPPQIIEELTTVRMSQRDKKTEKHHSQQQESRAQIMELQNPHINKPSLQNMGLDHSTIKKEPQPKDLDEVILKLEVTKTISEIYFVASQPTRKTTDLEHDGVKNPPTTRASDLNNVVATKQCQENIDLDVIMKKASQQTADADYPLGKKLSKQKSDECQGSDEFQVEVIQPAEYSVGGSSEDEEEKPSEQDMSIGTVVVTMPFQQKKNFNNVQVKKSQKKLEA